MLSAIADVRVLTHPTFRHFVTPSFKGRLRKTVDLTKTRTLNEKRETGNLIPATAYGTPINALTHKIEELGEV